MFTTKNLFTIIGKQVFIALGVLVFTVASVFFISGQITKISAKAAKDRHLAATLSERTALLSSLKHETEIIGSNDVLIKHAFIPSNNILEFVATLESLALRNGLTQAFHFSSPTPSVAGTPFPLATISYQNTISSSNISSFINYLKEFELLHYFTKIDSLTISSSGGDWRTASNISFSASVSAQTAQ